MTESTNYSDIEIKMHAFRLMRSGNYKRAKELSKVMQEDFQQIPKERIDRCMKELCKSLIANEA